MRAIIFAHSHIDHFGGVQGVLQHLSVEEKASLQIIAPAGFEEEATSENIIAGPAMTRRAMYMYGKQLARGARGHVDTGLGKGPAFGTFGFASPTELISETGATLNITTPLFVDLLIGNAGLTELLFSDGISFEGSKLDLVSFFAMLDKPEGRFNVVVP